MKKILKIFKAIILTSAFSLLLSACSHNDNSKIDISHIIVNRTKAEVNLNQDTYDMALTNFKNIINEKISNFAKKDQKPEYGHDYKIVIINHDLSSRIQQYRLINVIVEAAITTHIITGKFSSQVNLVKPATDISYINIKKQNYDHTIIGKTTFKDILTKVLVLVEKNINNVSPNAKNNIDYVVNVEGHESSEVIKNLGDVNINVNAINNEYHNLLKGSFSFVVTIS